MARKPKAAENKAADVVKLPARMNFNQAFNVIDQVCRKFVGTRDDHALIQEALRVMYETNQKAYSEMENKKVAEDEDKSNN